MVNEIDQQEHVCVIQGYYYYRMVNDHKQRYTEEHPETKIEYINIFNLVNFEIFLPKHRLFQVNMEDIETAQEPHN
jgi:hypothetical protein